MKTLADFEFSFQPQINEMQIKDLASLGFMEQAENIVFLGSSGVGKTHLATSPLVTDEAPILLNAMI